METLTSYMPEDVYSLLLMGAVAFVVIWLAAFIIRRLIGFAILAALVIGGAMVWQNPGLLAAAPHIIGNYVGGTENAR